ncbi:uncharacterized protein LOC117342659 [Pecten maximus]|uniref:uncharacterized protein LOC117342659 n=1 Tax=Pecten maximus TaxID=6579 RepID=UPI001459142D|nr:uncharacterized protein LOC117342659 [Pecten maximus]
MDDVTAVLKEPARLECIVMDVGDWNNITIVLIGSDDVVYKRGEGDYTENGNNVTVSIDISFTQCDNAGIYTCAVDNAVTDTAEVHVTGKPENVTLSLSTLLYEGQPTSAVCEAIGTDDINIELHVKEPLSSTFKIFAADMTSQQEHNDCVILSSASFDFVPSFVDNGTELKCVAENTKLGVTSESKIELITVIRGDVSFDSYHDTLDDGDVSPSFRCTASNTSPSSRMTIYRRDVLGNDTTLVIYDGANVQYDNTRIQNGEISSDGNDLVLTFEISNVACEDIGIYSCVVNNSISILTSPDKVTTVKRPPGVPKLELDPHQTTIPNDPQAPSHRHKCSVDVGYPEGKMVIEILRAGAVTFEELTSTDLKSVSVDPPTWECSDTLRTMSFGISFQDDMEGALVRCVAVNGDGDFRTYSHNATIELVPDNICEDLGGDKVTAHPNNCHKHVECYSGVLVVNQCGDLCFVSKQTYAACDDCDNVPCPPRE